MGSHPSTAAPPRERRVPRSDGARPTERRDQATDSSNPAREPSSGPTPSGPPDARPDGEGEGREEVCGVVAELSDLKSGLVLVQQGLNLLLAGGHRGVFESGALVAALTVEATLARVSQLRPAALGLEKGREVLGLLEEVVKSGIAPLIRIMRKDYQIPQFNGPAPPQAVSLPHQQLRGASTRLQMMLANS